MVLSGVYLKGMMKELPGMMEFVLAAVSIWIVWNLKYYWVSIFLPIVCTSLVVQAVSIKLKIPSRLKLSLWVILFLFLCLCASLLHPNFHPMRILQVVIENNQAFVSHSDSGDVIHYGRLDATWGSVIRHFTLGVTVGVIQTFFVGSRYTSKIRCGIGK